jgi:TonB-dependent SusC/RagA subfamily outer membrane receptor
LRGTSSITGSNDPIVIVDGVRVYASQSDARNENLARKISPISNNDNNLPDKFAAPSPLDQIDPSSIETIEVLKGPSATAIYGSDAANGVIIITTKHGRAGPTQWALTVGEGVNWLPGNWPENYFLFGTNAVYGSYAGYLGDMPYLGMCVWTDPTCSIDSVVAFQALNDPRYTVLAHGSDQTASLTVSGGVPTLRYNLSGSAAGDVGNLKLPGIVQQEYDSAYGPIPRALVRPDHYTTYGVSGSLTAQPNPRVTVTLQSSLFNSAQQRSSLEGAITQLDGEYLNPTVLSGMEFNGTPLIDNEVEQATAGSLTATNALAFN